MHAVVGGNVSGGDEKTYVIPEGRAHEVRVGDVTAQPVGLPAAVPTVCADRDAERAEENI